MDGGPWIGYIALNALPNQQYAWEQAPRFDWMDQYALGQGPSEYFVELGTETVRLSDADPINIHAPTRTQSGRTFKRYTGALTTAQANYLRQASFQPERFFFDQAKTQKIEFRPAQIIPPLRWNDAVAPLIPPQAQVHTTHASDTQRPASTGTTVSQLLFNVAVGDRLTLDATAFVELIPGAAVTLALTTQQQGDTSDTEAVVSQALSVIGSATAEQMVVPLAGDFTISVAGECVVKLRATSSNTSHQLKRRTLRAVQYGVPRYAS